MWRVHLLGASEFPFAGRGDAGRLAGAPCPSSCSGRRHAGVLVTPRVPALAPMVGARWVSSEPGEASGCRMESAEPGPLGTGAATAGELSRVPLQARSGWARGARGSAATAAFLPQRGAGQGGLVAAAAGTWSEGRVQVRRVSPPVPARRSPGKDTALRRRSARSARGWLELGLWLGKRSRGRAPRLRTEESDCRARGSRSGDDAQRSPLPNPRPHVGRKPGARGVSAQRGEAAPSRLRLRGREPSQRRVPLPYVS